ncbi:hypothetical protein Scep_010132 [Stephania cephalantha]|uniref:Uncharacterized protein n=1 Tax=Stephania cephalantha TaxID=152367 RepID=A0AAP0JUF9_9MAGN
MWCTLSDRVVAESESPDLAYGSSDLVLNLPDPPRSVTPEKFLPDLLRWKPTEPLPEGRRIPSSESVPGSRSSPQRSQI